MAQVQPAEVTAILKQELAGFRSEAELEEVTVEEVEAELEAGQDRKSVV